MRAEGKLIGGRDRGENKKEHRSQETWELHQIKEETN